MNALIITSKVASFVVPGLVIGEVAGGVIDEKTMIPLKIAVGISIGTISIVTPFLWKAARALQRFVDEQKLMRANISNLRDSFKELYCVRNAECIEKGENDHE